MAEYHHRMVKRYIFVILYEMATAIDQDIFSCRLTRQLRERSVADEEDFEPDLDWKQDAFEHLEDEEEMQDGGDNYVEAGDYSNEEDSRVPFDDEDEAPLKRRKTEGGGSRKGITSHPVRGGNHSLNDLLFEGKTWEVSISRPKVDDRLQPSCHHTTGKDLPIGASLKHYIYVIKMLFLFLPKSVTRT